MVVVRFACCFLVCILRHLRFSLVQLVLTSRRAGWEYRRYRRQHGRKVEKSNVSVFRQCPIYIYIYVYSIYYIYLYIHIHRFTSFTCCVGESYYFVNLNQCSNVGTMSFSDMTRKAMGKKKTEPEVKDLLCIVCEQWKNLRCLGYIGDYATQLCGDYNKPNYKDPY